MSDNTLINYLKSVIKAVFMIKTKAPDKIEQLVKRGLKIGRNFNMQSECIIDTSHCWHIIIGDNVTLAPRVHILAHDASTKNHFNYVKIGKVNIGNNVFIGASSIILPGINIGDNAIIGAGSVVTKDIPDNTVYAGNPARFICNTEEFIKKRRLEMDEFPVFEEEYTIRANVSDKMKDEMNNRINDRFGYII
ncbi:acyltransferase [Carboxylicivirga marina]|uniref:acyltransferase n=1 Tax=Carboxylicivirga marina TaxID=2800988 RepID=UPI00259622AC|nr:DapH/DapD/GlmU-related protein [uncultured Carboxylicivirga sp.]